MRFMNKQIRPVSIAAIKPEARVPSQREFLGIPRAAAHSAGAHTHIETREKCPVGVGKVPSQDETRDGT